MSPRGRPDDPAERATRILDAAAKLVLRFGHDRTTISDVARVAGVAKGSVYAHWSSRELLFRALLRREQARLLTEVRDRLRAEAGPADLRRLLIESVQAYQRNPLLLAVLTRNTEILGVFAVPARGEGAPSGPMVTLLAQLREQGLVRTDHSLAEQVTVFSSVFLGYFLTAPLLPAQFRVPDDAVPALVADAARGVLERTEPLNPDEAAALGRTIDCHLDAAAKAATARLSEEDAS